MNYQKHYDALIQRAQSRQKPEGYVERHHILPRCMGGGNARANLVYLTAEEHFVAHQLLVRVFPNVKGLIYAARRLAMAGKVGNKAYAWIRKRFAIAASEAGKLKRLFPEHKEKLRLINTGRKMSPEQREILRIANVGRKLSPESHARISALNAVRMTPEVRAKLSTANRGKTLSPDRIAKLVAANTGKKRSAETCQKISRAKMGNKTMLGKHHSAETKQKISLASMGNKRAVGAVRSPETRAIISAKARARYAARQNETFEPVKDKTEF